jgi:acyl carrier protein phosphodiesterase
MNYLAHAYLSRQHPPLMAGGVLGDFIKGGLSAFPDHLRFGLQLHRKIDQFTDRHPLVLQSKEIIDPALRRFSGILMDVYCDHFLARHWPNYHHQPLSKFTNEVYGVLAKYQAYFPARFQFVYPRMKLTDWLYSYQYEWAVDVALRGISRRFRDPRRAQPLLQGMSELKRHYRLLERIFFRFFPDLEAYAANQIRRYNTFLSYPI